LIYAVVAFQKKSLKSKLTCLQASISLCPSLSDIKKCMLSLCCCYINNKKITKINICWPHSRQFAAWMVEM